MVVVHPSPILPSSSMSPARNRHLARVNLPHMKKIEGVESLIAAAREEGQDVVLGKPASEAEIAELEREVGFSFPDDYRAFLLAYGALAIVADRDEGTATLEPVILGTVRDDSTSALSLKRAARTFRAGKWGYKPAGSFVTDVAIVGLMGGEFIVPESTISAADIALSDEVYSEEVPNISDMYMLSTRGIG